MANPKTRDPNWRQASGWYAEGAGHGRDLHVREEMVIPGVIEPPVALVIKLYADRWVTTVEPWKGTQR